MFIKKICFKGHFGVKIIRLRNC